MAELLVAYDPSKPPGQRLAPEVRAELALLAPWGVPNAAITEEKIADESVSKDKIKPEAVTEEKIADGAITSDKLQPGSVNFDAVAWHAIHPECVAPGVVTSKDGAEEDVGLTLQPVTPGRWSWMGGQGQPPRDNNTLYIVSTGAPGNPGQGG